MPNLSAAEIQEATDALIPGDGQAEALAFIAESIEVADEIASDRWALTFAQRGRDMRLNVARPQVIHAHDGFVSVEVDEDEAPRELVEMLRKDGRAERWMRQEPQALSLTLTPAELAEWSSRLRPAHDAVIAAVATTMSAASPYRRAHSAEVLSYLADRVGKDLPSPSYPAANGVNNEKLAEAVRICVRILEDRADFDAEERLYKLDVAERVQSLLASQDDAEFIDRLKEALKDPPNNLIGWRTKGELTTFGSDDPATARLALSELAGGEPVGERIDRFNEVVPRTVNSTSGSRLSIASMILMGISPTEYAMYRASPYKTVQDVLGWPRPDHDLSHGAQYEAHLRFTKELREMVSAESGTEIDILDAQGLIWILAKRDDLEINAWRGDRPTDSSDLAAAIADFRERRGYPSAEDTEAHAAREELAQLLDESSLPDLSREAFSQLLKGREYGFLASAGVTAQRTLNNADDDEWARIKSELALLLHAEGDTGERIDQFLAAGIPGFKEAVATKLLAIVHHEDVLPVFAFHGANGKQVMMQSELLGLEEPSSTTIGGIAAESNDLLVETLAPFFGTDTWGMSRFLFDGGEDQEQPNEDIETIEALNSSLNLEAGFLETCRKLLLHKRQLILYGPPGTGKTYIARKLGRFLADEGSFEIVQFHPSYSYEDFIQGYRPVQDDSGGLTYVLRPGPLLELAQRANKAPNETFVLLIDEINRGNLPRIFGVLLFALEYRDESVRLMYGKHGEEHLSLPQNLLIIATMNTADRSIGLIDAALRRRFHFRPLFPARPPLDNTLRGWLKKNAAEMQHVADLVETLNMRLRARLGNHLQVGHSYFMRSDLNEDLLDEIWEADIMPFLEDQMFGETKQLSDYPLESLRASESSEEAEDSEEGLDEIDPDEGVGAADASTDSD